MIHNYENVVLNLGNSTQLTIEDQDFPLSSSRPSSISQKETAAKVYLQKSAGFFLFWLIFTGCNLVTRFYIQNNPLNMIFIILSYIFNFSTPIESFWSMNFLAYLWIESDENSNAFDILSLLTSIFTITLKMSKVIDICSVSGFSFALPLIASIFSLKSQRNKKTTTRALLRCFYMVQTLLITFKIDGYLDWTWNSIFTIFWLFVGIIAICTVQCNIKFARKLNSIRSTISRDTKVGLLWWLLFNTLTIFTIASLYGAINSLDGIKNSTLSFILYMSLFLNLILLIYTLLLRNKLISFIASFDLMENRVVKTEEEDRTRKELCQIAEKTQCQFVMMSPTYFVPFRKDLLTERKELNRDEKESLCYICFKNRPDAIFMRCGHGGICHDCAICVFQSKNECAECREKIEALYRINPDPINGNIVKGIEIRRVLSKEENSV